MEYYSAIKKNEFKLVLVKWMNLEPLVQSEITQKKKNKCSRLTYICIYVI